MKRTVKALTVATITLVTILFGYQVFADAISSTGTRDITNNVNDGDLVLRVKDGGSLKEAIKVTGSTGLVTLGASGEAGTHTVNGALNVTGSITGVSFGGLGTMSAQNSDNVSITGGSITGLTSLGVSNAGAASLEVKATSGNNASQLILDAAGTSVPSVSLKVGGTQYGLWRATGSIPFQVFDATGATSYVSVNTSGLWTIGKAGETGTHTINGNLAITGSYAPTVSDITVTFDTPNSGCIGGSTTSTWKLMRMGTLVTLCTPEDADTTCSADATGSPKFTVPASSQVLTGANSRAVVGAAVIMNSIRSAGYVEINASSTGTNPVGLTFNKYDGGSSSTGTKGVPRGLCVTYLNQ